MFKSSSAGLAAALLLLLPAARWAQQPQPSSTVTAKLQHRQVLASVSGQALRFAALGELLQLRLEVISPTGERVFDSQFKAGNLIAWPAVDSQGQRLPDGTYLCRVSVKEADGEMSHRQALVAISGQAVRLRSLDKSLLSAAQAQAADEALADEASMTVVEEATASATAILAHDGQAAQLVSASGGLVISSGDFFAGRVLEHVRLTAEGKVGIGISQPQFQLDVNGMIRASQGIVFPDGSVQFSASRKTFGAASLKPGQLQQKQKEDGVLEPDIGGTGTTGKIAKWQDGPAGILNDSNITEASGAIGINGTPSTSFRLDVNGSTRIRGSNPGFNLEGLGNGNVWLFQTVDTDGHFRIFGQDNATPGAERLTINMNGNIGLGISNPTTRLHVAGDVRSAVGSSGSGGRFTALNPNNQSALAHFDWINDGTKDWPRIRYGGTGEGAINGFLIQGPSDVTKLAILNSGNVGVGTVTPAAKLDVAGNINSATHYDLGGLSLLSIGGSNNLFVGVGAGASNSGGSNTFVGFNAGNANGSSNNNAFFGASSGAANTGFNNAFFGNAAGSANLGGNRNAFFGHAAGNGNVSGSDLTMIGDNATTGANNLTNATAIGAKARVDQSDSLVLGSISGVNGASVTAKVGIGTATPTARLDVNGDVKVSGTITLAPQTRHLNISAAAFVVTQGGRSSLSGGGISLLNDGNVLEPMNAGAAVNLPDGAVVTRVRVEVDDDDGDTGKDINIQLRRSEFGTGNATTMADVSSVGTGSHIIPSDTSIINPTIDNGAFTYFIAVSSPTGSIGTWRLWAVIIDYTVTSPLP